MPHQETALATEQLVEAVLFVAEGPVRLDELVRALQVEPEEAERGLSALEASLSGRGLRLVRVGQRVQLVTAPGAAEAVDRFLGGSSSAKLSAAALETLAIIAYRQPVTRAQIEAIRGVNSDGVIRTLIARGLVEPLGRLDQAGRPEILGTTFEFLQYFGITSLSELPKLPELEEAVEAMALDGSSSVDGIERQD